MLILISYHQVYLESHSCWYCWKASGFVLHLTVVVHRCMSCYLVVNEVDIEGDFHFIDCWVMIHRLAIWPAHGLKPACCSQFIGSTTSFLLSWRILLRTLPGTDRSIIPWYCSSSGLLFLTALWGRFLLIPLECFLPHRSSWWGCANLLTDVSVSALMASAVFSPNPAAFPFLSVVIAPLILVLDGLLPSIGRFVLAACMLGGVSGVSLFNSMCSTHLSLFWFYERIPIFVLHWLFCLL